MMKVPIAYAAVVLIWSTTPLGIIWSSDTVPPAMAVFLRMMVAALIGTLLLMVLRIKLPMSANARKLYIYSTLGVFGGMMCSYFASPYVTSGFMSLVFGLSPIISGILAHKILNESSFDRSKIVAMILSFTGLVIVCWDKLNLNSESFIGITLLLIAVTVFSLSAVMVKSVTINIHPLATTLGTLYFSIPLFFITWLITSGGQIEIAQWSQRSLLAILYLGIFGSLIGFIAYFFTLQRLAASTVSLITLITPIFAIMLGTFFNGEQITPGLIIGTIFILLGLSLFFWGKYLFLKSTSFYITNK